MSNEFELNAFKKGEKFQIQKYQLDNQFSPFVKKKSVFTQKNPNQMEKFQYRFETVELLMVTPFNFQISYYKLRATVILTNTDGVHVEG